MSPASKAVFVPPRPNLGPEPMPERWSLLWVILIVLASVSILFAVRRALPRLRSLVRHARRHAPSDASPGWPEIPPEDPREQWIAWSRAVRSVLVERFGPAWGAKTTEELAAEPALASLLGPEQVARLLRALGEADRAKFADPSHFDLSSPLPHLDLLAALAPEAGASSRTRGK